MSVAVARVADADAELMALYQAAFADLVAYLDTLLGDRAGAEDVAQEAGMRLMQWRRDNDAPLLQPRAFLFRIATNLARDQLRRQIVRRDAAVEIERRAEPVHGADVVAAAREQLAAVQAAVATLPPRPREVLLLARLDGCSHREIGERLGISAKTVENHLARALAMLAQRLRDDEPGR